MAAEPLLVLQARHADREAAAHRDRVVAAKLQNCRRLIGWLHREGRLAPPWTTQSASDMLFALVSSDMIEALISERQWSRRRLADHLALVLRSTFAGQAAHDRPGAGAGRPVRR